MEILKNLMPRQRKRSQMSSQLIGCNSQASVSSVRSGKKLPTPNILAQKQSEWAWSTNWKITKMPGVTDAEGWEYASRFSRFKIKDRAPKSEARWSRARRRLWTRIMRREPVVKTTDMTKVLSKVQGGLTSIHSARIKIEQIMRSAPEAATSDQMKSLVASVERNIADILSVLDQAEQQAQQSSSAPANGSAKASTSPAVLKKLRNDVLKEQVRAETQFFLLLYFYALFEINCRWLLSGHSMVDLL